MINLLIHFEHFKNNLNKGILMENKIKITGGKSGKGRISIYSNRYKATASYNSEGAIKCEIEPLGYITKFLIRNKKFPIPRLLKLYLAIIEDVPLKFIVGLYFAFYFVEHYGRNFPLISLIIVNTILSIPILIVVYFLVRMKKDISSWHGAEHMAISAYDKYGSTDLDDIKRESPVHEKCGGRFVLPFIASIFLSNFLFEALGINEIILNLIIIETILWIDELKGWNKIPITSQFSRFLQKSYTTKMPSDYELLIARTAIIELIRNHQP